MVTVLIPGEAADAALRQTEEAFGCKAFSEEEQEQHTVVDDIPVTLRLVGPGTLPEAVGAVTDAYLAVLYPGESYDRGTLGACVRALEENRDKADAAVPETETDRKHAAMKKRPNEVRLLHTDRVTELAQSPGFFGCAVVRTSAAREAADIPVREETCRREFMTALAMERKKALLYVSGRYCFSNHPLFLQGGYCAALSDGKWYLNVAEGCRSVLKDGKEAALVLQAQVIQILRVLYYKNMNAKDKKALDDDSYAAFLDRIRELLPLLEPGLMDQWQDLHADRKINYYQLDAWMELQEDLIETVPLPVMLMLTEYENGCLIFNIGIPAVLRRCRIRAEADGEALSMTECGCSPGIRMFGRPLPFSVMSISLPLERLGRKKTLRFVAERNGRRMILPVVTAGYQSRISGMVRGSYWCFDRYMVCFSVQKAQEKGRRNKNDGIRILRAGRIRRMAQEASVLLRMPFGPDRSREMTVERLLYWAAWPTWHKKNIWLTFDKLYKGGDNGEYFYKYLLKRKDPSITPAYLINRDAPDCARLVKEGCHPLAKGSRQQRLTYLYAGMVFATHSNVPEFNGFNRWKIHFIQDRLRAVNTCIQHGLSVQDLTLDSNRLINNNKRYYCASPCEVENLSKPAYDYPDEVLRLTGVPRYDGLVNDDRKQILITPTWRSYIAMPAVMGAARPYNPEFRQTEYFRIYESLITNERLLKEAKRHGYRIVYLLHPVTSAQITDYTAGENVQLVSGAETDYEALLTQSSLMVTDYSGVQFDFAYMRKPVLYYHHPALPPHFTGGGFDYETQGFGPVCTSQEQLVDAICRAMENGCRVEPRWKERQDAFFTFSDHENCRRIFEDAFEYQGARQENRGRP